MSAALRIGEVARAAGTTVRTIRYYEEIGLLAGAGDRAAGSHRTYDEQDVARIVEILRLKDLLGVSLEELRRIVAAEDARELRREEFRAGGTSPRRRAEILREGLANVEHQRALVAARRAQLDELDAELAARHERIVTLLDEQHAPAAGR